MKSARLIVFPFFFVLGGAGATGCFALFSLDDYGPPGVDAGTDVPVIVPVDTGPGPTPEAAPPVDTRPTKRIFVTSTTTNGNLGGLAGADNTCKLLATGAGLGGNFKAWLSIDDQSPRTRFFPVTDAGLPDERVIDTTGQTVAQSWTSLFAKKTLLVPIEYNERGVKLVATADGGAELAPCGSTALLPVWTNTSEDGQPVNTENDCENFQSNVGATRIGYVSPAGAWTSGCDVACTVKAHLYCVEQ